MRITDDEDVDALYIRFGEVTVTTEHVAEGIAADCGPDGRLAGIEILDASQRVGDPRAFRSVVLENVAVPASLTPPHPLGFRTGIQNSIASWSET